jgi:chlorobactene glucosyltransferase
MPFEVLVFLVIPLLGFGLVQCLFNIRLLQRLVPTPSDFQSELQDISVLVPARNEEIRIGDCLASLLNQKPPVGEIILLDDRSTDRTAEIAVGLGFREGEGNRLRLIRGEDLPPGWVGKNWACHQLQGAAERGSSHILFTDADTVHHPECVRTALSHARSERADLLSLWPDQITGTWSEKLIIPLGYLLFMAFHPFLLLNLLQACPARVRRWKITRPRLASLGAANGQFLLFRRSSYDELGGHEALKDHLVEDIAFGRRVASRTGEGWRLVNADGMRLLRCRMYYNLGGLWEGFSKNLRPVFEKSFASFVLFGVVVGGLFLLPFLFLASGGILGRASLVAVLLIALMRLILTLRFRTSWLGFIAHPFGIVLALLIALNSWRLCVTKGVSWKGRVYSGNTPSSLG